MPEPSIVLVGPPAVGKSTVGAILARRLGCGFTDVDELIEESQQRPISEIFATQGEAHFRELEYEATMGALDCGGVVALGGGAVTNPRLRTGLAGHNVVWLRASASEAVLRVGDTTTRPLLHGDVRAKWDRLASEREPLYAEVATVVVDTDRRAPSKVARLIIEELGLEENR